jgi:hypothetical protein
MSALGQTADLRPPHVAQSRARPVCAVRSPVSHVRAETPPVAPHLRGTIQVGRMTFLALNASYASGRATHAPNTRVHRHRSVVKLLAPSPPELCKREPAPRRPVVLYKPGLRKPAVPRTPVGRLEPPVLGPRTRSQVQPRQCHRPRLLQRQSLRMPRSLLRERVLYSSPIFLCVVRRCRAPKFNEDCTSWFDRRLSTTELPIGDVKRNNLRFAEISRSFQFFPRTFLRGFRTRLK